MKKNACIAAFLYCFAILASTAVMSSSVYATETPIDPCLGCHAEETAGVVKQWETGKHSKTGVKCYVCHYVEVDNPNGMEHEGYFIITDVSIATCESCHPENGMELRKQFSKTNAKHP
jgi:hypothetical protein